MCIGVFGPYIKNTNYNTIRCNKNTPKYHCDVSKRKSGTGLAEKKGSGKDVDANEVIGFESNEFISVKQTTI